MFYAGKRACPALFAAVSVCARTRATPSSAASLSSLSVRCGGASARRLALPPRPEEANPVHQDPAERAGEGVRGQQIHHQGQAQEDLRRDQPVGATDHHLVPEQARQGEEVRGQSEEQRAVNCAVDPSGEGLFSEPVLTTLGPTFVALREKSKPEENNQSSSTRNSSESVELSLPAFLSCMFRVSSCSCVRVQYSPEPSSLLLARP